MKIGIIDADLIGRHKHRFPNLASEKIAAYWKEQNAEMESGGRNMATREYTFRRKGNNARTTKFNQ